MSVLKDLSTEVQEYTLDSLINKQNVHSSDFELEKFSDTTKVSAQTLMHEQSEANKTDFSIDNEVESHRGIKKLKKDEYENRVETEVERRLAEIKEKVEKEAYEKGFTKGEAEAKEKTIKEFEEKLSIFDELIANVVNQGQEIITANKDQVYNMVHKLTKWIVLKEVDEKFYLARLLEKLVYEINTKSNLVIRVDENSFGYMPEIVKVLERKIGLLANTRIEIDQDLEGPGIILESENSVIDGSLEAQMNSLDELFNNVGKHE